MVSSLVAKIRSVGTRPMAALSAAVLVVGLAGAPQAFASSSEVRVAQVDYGQGTIRVGVRCDSGPDTLLLTAGDAPIDATVPSGSGDEVSFGSYRLEKKTTFRVIAKSASGAELWRRALTVDPASYRPRTPKLSVPAGTVVPSRWTISGTAKRPVTWVKVYVRQTEKYRTVRMEAIGSGRFSIKRVPIPYGPATIVVRAKNGFGSSPKAVRRVYQLGTRLPKSKRFVLVCKKTLWLYHVRKGRVIDRWPVAIGTPQTPTPSGTFRIGRPSPASGDWGVLRRRLWKVRKGPNRPMRYFIHGTSTPSSIGTQASHGCVRMYNKHVRQFAKRIPNGTLVRIR